MDFQMSSVYNEGNERWDVKLSGEIDIFNSAKLKKMLTELLDKHDAHLYLYCESLEYIDSTALGALVGVMKTVKSNNREMHLISVKPNLMKLFRITNLDKVFVIEEGAQDA